MSIPYVTKLNPKETNPILVFLRTYANEHDIPIITEDGIRFLHQILQLKQAKKVLEIGSAIGYSAIAMALKNDVQVWTIEREADMVEQAKRNIKHAGLENQITIIEADALEIDETTLPSVDVIFIDGAKAQSARFFSKFQNLLPVGGVIVTDNLLFHGLVHGDTTGKSRNLIRLVEKIDDFNHFLIEQEQFDTVIYELGDGMSVSIKKE
ncbi:O-methyltransferase [Candidatus Xianfuyuplasma coldseepsis]|uniref:O-methyltransferase n=1 Tax=Candidatus Xianfuyuplasma coldseepsis TaxID=2782163 RepID=A0A7L7KSN8_9MOLU|nr:O-methyltransferase [Xianfuyuplasma coldseepsis]QMS85615.1 O-methyltransferase [Xianfuyuplasma coldseepsis]